MATVVPYSPTPTIQPQQNPTPFRSLNVPADAFGAATAAATERFGKAESQVGDELYSRALGMQELNERARSNEAVSSTQNKQLAEWEKFRQLPGDQAAQQLPAFMQRMDQMRRDGAGNLSPYARSFYDNEVRSSQFWMNRTASAHAADENKKFYQGSLTAQVESAKNQVGIMPENQAMVDAALAKVEEKARELGASKGWSKEQTDLYIANEKSDTVKEQLKSLGRTKPYAADKLREAYAGKGHLSSQDNNDLTAYLKGQMLHAGTSDLSSGIMAGTVGDWGKGIIPISDAKVGVSAAEGFKGDYSVRGPLIRSGPYAGQKAAGRYQVMPGNLSSWLKDVGMKDMSLDEFLHDPDSQEELFEKRFSKRMQVLGSFDRALAEWFTGNPDAPPDRNDGYNTMAQYRATAYGALAKASGARGVADMARKVSGDVKPGDAEHADELERKTVVKFANQEKLERIELADNQNAIWKALQPDATGKLITNEDQLTADPETAKAVEYMKDKYPKQWASFKKIIDNNALHGGYGVTQVNTNEYNHFMGMAQHPEDLTSDEREYLIRYDIPSARMPNKFAQTMATAQRELIKQATVTPKGTDSLVKQTMSNMEDQLKDLGIGKGAVEDKQAYYQIKGALHDILEDHVNIYKKQPSEADLETIGNRLLEKHTEPGTWWGTNNVPMYHLQVPDKERANIVAAWQGRHQGAMPSDQQIQSAYVAALYNAQFNKRPKSETGRSSQ